MAKLTKKQTMAHEQAVDILKKDVLTDDDKEFVFNNWHEAANHNNGANGAFFTPLDMAWDFALDVPGTKIIDLCAGIGVLAYTAMCRLKHNQKHSANYSGIFPISSKAITAMKKTRSATVVIEDGILNVLDSYGYAFYQEDVSEIDGTFPEWRKILPTGDFKPTVRGLNAEVMAIVSSVSRILNNVGFTIKEKDDGESFSRCLVAYDRNQDIRSVVQTCALRGSQDVPEWYADCVQAAL